MDELKIATDSIRLGQLLKLADLADSGVAAKLLLASGAVQVNGEIETRRGRQLSPGDVVSHGEMSIRLTERLEQGGSEDLSWPVDPA